MFRDPSTSSEEATASTHRCTLQVPNRQGSLFHRGVLGGYRRTTGGSSPDKVHHIASSRAGRQFEGEDQPVPRFLGNVSPPQCVTTCRGESWHSDEHQNRNQANHHVVPSIVG